MPHPAPAHKSFADRVSLYQEITDKIIAELEAGRVPWVQPWGKMAAPAPLGVPKNAATGRRYFGINIIILWSAVMERGWRSALLSAASPKCSGHLPAITASPRRVSQSLNFSRAAEIPFQARPCPSHRIAGSAAGDAVMLIAYRRAGPVAAPHLG